MPEEPALPFSIVVCNAMVGAAAWLVPGGQRGDWRREWKAEIWHRWRFLTDARAWDGREARRLVGSCVGAFADAAWHLISQETVRERMRDWARSPWTCLGGLTALLLMLAMVTAGFPATQQMFGLESRNEAKGLLFIWLHPVVGGGDQGLPPDVVPAWATHSAQLESVAAFNIRKTAVVSAGTSGLHPLVIATDPRLFAVLRAHAEAGRIPTAVRNSEVVLDDSTWAAVFHRDKKAVGSQLQIGRDTYRVSAVLAPGYRFITRRASVFVVQHEMADARVMVIARARPGATTEKIDRELTRIAESATYYFFNSQLRFEFFNSGVLMPLTFFGVAFLVSALLTAMVCGVRLRNVRLALRAENRETAARRALFFAGKASLALAFVFVVGLEWCRPESSILFASKDPASGPFLVWLYILGTMGVFFWSVADQRARCRVCLRLLCFPVRIGCPGCLLLDWSGTELLCTEGHGLLHVPHLAPSWDEEGEHWIALDESWRGLFAHSK